MHPLLAHAWVVAQTTAAQTATTPAPAASAPSFGDSIALSMTAAFATLFTIIPRLLGFIVIVAVG